MSTEDSSTPVDAWDRDLIALARHEYTLELEKTRSFTQAAGTTLTILAGTVVLKWAQSLAGAITLARIAALVLLGSVYFVLVTEDQHRIPLSDYVHENKKNPDHGTWYSNLIDTYEEAIRLMRNDRASKRCMLFGAFVALLALAFFGLI